MGEFEPIIDAVPAEHDGFTTEELDFIVNYDITYRLGADESSPDVVERIGRNPVSPGGNDWGRRFSAPARIDPH